MADYEHRRSSDRTLLNAPAYGSVCGQSTPHKQSLDSRQHDDEEQCTPGNLLLPVDFFHVSLRPVWKQVTKKWLCTVFFFIMCFILSVLSLYWAVLFHTGKNLQAIEVAVVDFDSGIAPHGSAIPPIGSVVQRLARTQAFKDGSLGYIVQPPSQYNNDPLAVRQAVYEEHIWAAIIVNANATSLLRQAIATGDGSYDPLGAGHIIVNSARDQNTYADYIIPVLSQFQISATSIFAEQWIPSVLGNSSLSSATYSRCPQALNPAFGFSTVDLRPFYPYQITPTITIGLIYLIIMAFFSFSFFLPVYMEFLIPRGHPPIHFWQLILIRLFATTFASFFMSLCYSLVSLAFQIPFSATTPHVSTEKAMNHNAYGKGTFVVYWMLNWVGMYALGLASENVTMIVGQPWTAL